MNDNPYNPLDDLQQYWKRYTIALANVQANESPAIENSARGE